MFVEQSGEFVPPLADKSTNFSHQNRVLADALRRQQRVHALLEVPVMLVLGLHLRVYRSTKKTALLGAGLRHRVLIHHASPSAQAPSPPSGSPAAAGVRRAD